MLKNALSKRDLYGQIYRVHIETNLRDKNFVMEDDHFHPYNEIIFIESGTCTCFITDKMYKLNKGDLVLIPFATFHYIRYLDGPCLKSSIFFKNNELLPNTINLINNDDFFKRPQFFKVPTLKNDIFLNVISKMRLEEKISDDNTITMLQLLLNELFLICNRERDYFISESPLINTTDEIIVKAANFINNNYHKRIKLTNISTYVGYSPNYLTNKFKTIVGINVHEYLNIIRLKHALHELKTTNDSITNIAYRTGFSNSNYFKDVFKKHYGKSPSNFRKEI